MNFAFAQPTATNNKDSVYSIVKSYKYMWGDSAKGEKIHYDSIQGKWFIYHKYHSGGDTLSITIYDQDGWTLIDSTIVFYDNGNTGYVIHYCPFYSPLIGETSIQNGTLKQFYSNGHPKKIGSYYYGLKPGPWKQYHPNGKLSSLSEYNLHSEDSTFAHYFTNKENWQSYLAADTVKTDCCSHSYWYLTLGKNGDCFEFDDSGTPISYTLWKKGKLIETIEDKQTISKRFAQKGYSH